MNAKGYTVANAELIERIHDMIVDIEDSGRNVEFWKIPREDNYEANALASMALDRMERLSEDCIWYVPMNWSADESP